MRTVQLTMHSPTVAPAEAFSRISDFGRYPALVDVVRSVTVHPAPPGAPVPSDWEVSFRNGILRWSEIDTIDRQAGVIHFVQTTGDFAEFTGDWSVRPAGEGCDIRFGAAFDFGIPSLAGILDPIAARALAETITSVIAGLLGPVSAVEDEDPTGAVTSPRGDRMVA